MDLVITASGFEGARAAALEQLLSLVPALADGALASADLGLATPRRRFAAVLHLCRERTTGAIRDRLAFWSAREGASARPLDEMTPLEVAGFREELAACNHLLRDVAPDRYRSAVRELALAAGSSCAPLVPGRPVLALHVGGPCWEEFTYDRGTRTLDVPMPLAPPVGDELTLQLQVPDLRVAFATRARVTAVRSLGDARPGGPAGFSVVLLEAAERMHLALAARCAPRASGSSRRAARCCAAGRVDLGEGGPEAFLGNLSAGGAFVRTSAPSAPGTSVDLRMRLPGGGELATPATVVHSSPSGMGVSFALDASGEAVLSAALTSIAARRRHVLVIDDNALARRLLADVFERRGFEVSTSADGEAGLRAIIDELFSLDAVVSDVCMPGFSGEDLVRAVRGAGGEQDLALVLVTAESDGARRLRMTAAGADAVVCKDAGLESAVDAVEAALESRRTAAAGGAETGAPRASAGCGR